MVRVQPVARVLTYARSLFAAWSLAPLALGGVVLHVATTHAAVRASAVTPSPEQEALDRLNAAAYALREARGLTFRLRTSADGILATGTPIIDYAVTMARLEGPGGMWKVRVEGEGRRRPSDQPLRITAAFDETTVTWVDHEKREVHTRPIRSARGTVTQLIHAARVPEVMSREPLAKELVAPEMFTESSSEADGVACDVVVVRTENKVAATRWWFGKDDILPRRIVKSVQSASGSGTSTVEFLEIKVDDRLREADLRVDIPDGYSAVSADDTPAGRLGLPARTVNQGSASPGSPSTTAGPATGASQGRFDPSDDPSNHRDPDHERPLDLLFKSENGTEFTLSSLRDRPVILCFVASWSLPSRAAIPRIEAARTNFGEAAHVLALTVRERFPDQAGEFIRARGSTARVVPVGDDAATALGIRILPAVVVIDRRGNMVHAVQGMSIDDWDALPERIPRSE